MALLHDQKSSTLLVTNSAAVEVVCRDVYGIIKAFEDVGSAGDNGQKKKVKYRARDQYDVASLWDFDPTCPSADRAVTKAVRDGQAVTKALGPGGAD